MLELFSQWVWFVVIVGLTAGVLVVADILLLRRPKLSLDKRLPRQITMLVLTVLAIVTVVLALPNQAISEGTRGDLLSLIGLAVTAIITLSSTTLAANGMAGLMLRATSAFRGGDWVRVGEHFGRVTERGLFHTEIQTEDSDLVSLPNLFLATNPLRIVRESGTIVSAQVSLGYDVPHGRAQELLAQAAEKAGLIEPFVWVIDLLDHAVVYRAAGKLEDVKGLISVRSKLRVCILDVLHGAGVEIASPSVVIQRRGDLTDVMMPAVGPRSKAEPEDAQVEARVFDKAEQAAKIEQLRDKRKAIAEEIETLRADRKSSDSETARETISEQEAKLSARLEQIDAELEAGEAEKNGNGASPA